MAETDEATDKLRDMIADSEQKKRSKKPSRMTKLERLLAEATTDADRKSIQGLMAEQARLEAKIARTAAKTKERNRRDDARRKILVGATCLAHAERDPDFKAKLDSWLIAETEGRNRYLFPDLFDTANENEPEG